MTEIFHSFVMKCMFLSKRGRPDIQIGVSFLSTRVKRPTECDWNKLSKILKFLNHSKDDVITLSMDDTETIKWYVDASFGVHPDMKSHTGAVCTLGEGCMMPLSLKQKVNARSSTESELIALDDVLSKILWLKKFIDHQTGKTYSNIVHRDNQSTMKMEINGKESSGKRTRHFDIKYYYITDLIKRGLMKEEYCPLSDMIANFMTKLLVASKFDKLRNKILGYHTNEGQQECVEYAKDDSNDASKSIANKHKEGVTSQNQRN
jgi:hypothetical protein